MKTNQKKFWAWTNQMDGEEVTERVLELNGTIAEVYFEKENIYTFDGKGELLITIMASLAQEESRSISENVTWGQRKRFADGKVSLPYKSFVGYKKGENDIPEAVQYEVARRKTLGKRYSGTSIFAAKIVCADCGAFYGAKVWHSNSKYKKTVWRCNAKFDGEKHCDTPTLDEEEIKARFLSVFNGLLDQKEETIENLRFVQDTLTES